MCEQARVLHVHEVMTDLQHSLSNGDEDKQRQPSSPTCLSHVTWARPLANCLFSGVMYPRTVPCSHTEG